MGQTIKQKKAWDKLNSLYDQYPVRPLRYGFSQPSLKDSLQYDYPGLLRNWQQDKRKTNIPDYTKVEEV